MIAFAIVYSLLALLLYYAATKSGNASRAAQKEFYDHLDRFWNGDFKEEMEEKVKSE